LTISFQEKVKVLISPSHVKTLKTIFLLIIFVIQTFLNKKLRINTIKRPKPIKAKEKVNKKDNPIINVLILEDILCTISDELEGLCSAK
tara:strand:+ start:63 stop:329 length:267 start_codon:yes stop_codon:yes gene_type:complete